MGISHLLLFLHPLHIEIQETAETPAMIGPRAFRRSAGTRHLVLLEVPHNPPHAGFILDLRVSDSFTLGGGVPHPPMADEPELPQSEEIPLCSGILGADLVTQTMAQKCAIRGKACIAGNLLLIWPGVLLALRVSSGALTGSCRARIRCCRSRQWFDPGTCRSSTCSRRRL